MLNFPIRHELQLDILTLRNQALKVEFYINSTK